MEKIELFDKYIAGKLSEAEVDEFRKRVDSDETFATEFKVYLIAVRGICQEAEQENIEFYHAMKSMTKAQLQSIIGKPETPRKVRSDFFRERLIWISSMAAMLVVAIGIGWKLHTSMENQQLLADNRLCDVIYSYEYKPVTDSRGDGVEYVNLNNLTPEQTEALIPELKKKFETDETDSQVWHIDGMNLAMAYLKLHHKEEALEVLNDMAANTSEPEPYNRIIEQLK